jgi:hypothetical protein
MPDGGNDARNHVVAPRVNTRVPYTGRRVVSLLNGESTMQRIAAAFAGVFVLLTASGPVRSDEDPPADQLPHFAKDGALLPPQGWEAWVMVGSSTGLSYNAGAAPAAGAAPGMFHNVYMQPWAYREFLKTGAFPQQTMFVLSFYEPSRKSTPARAGFYEGDRLPGFEVSSPNSIRRCASGSPKRRRDTV